MSAPTPKSEISNWAILSRLLRMTSAYRGRVGVILVLQVALLVSELVGLTFVGAGIDFLKFNFTDASGSPKWPLGWAPPEAWGAWSIIVFAAVAAVVAALLRGVLAWWAQRESSLLIHRDVVPDIQRRVFNKLQELHFRYFDTQTSGGIINRATGDIAAIRMFVETVLIETIILVITVTIYIVFMMQISPFLTLVCLATLPLMIAAALIFSKVIRPQYLERKRAFDRMILLLSESVQGIHTILGFAREPEMQQRFRERNEYVVEQQRGIFLCFSIFQPVVHLFTHFNLVILLLVGGKMVIDGQLAVGAELFVYAVLLQQFQNQVGTITNVANTVQDSFSAAERVFEVLDTPPEVETPQHPVTLERIHGAVTFENVSFQFSEKKSTLREISLSAEPGSTTAIVGETGSGKSALLSLLPRFYDPDERRILLDGIDLRRLELRRLREAVGVVFQEPLLFSDTIEGNIKFGYTGATDELMIESARQAAAHDFISALPDGYQTIVEEGGVNLSGGQRQRIALARALMTQPKILLLDDPTSAIDPETEDEILAAINRVIESRTTFIVAHRLSTLKRADTIIVLKNGRIVEQGTHKELLRRAGEYAQAAAIQMIDEESRAVLSRLSLTSAMGGVR